MSIVYNRSIHTTLQQLNKTKRHVPFFVMVALAGILFFGGIFYTDHISGLEEGARVLGGPVSHPTPTDPLEISSLAQSTQSAESSSDIESSLIAGSTSLQDDGGILSVTAAKTGVISYTVSKGDTLSEIAEQFGVSIRTILHANPELSAKYLKVGQKINILPVSGILYHPQEGETVRSVAASFNLSEDQLREFNPSISNTQLVAGAALVIPGVRSQLSRTNSQSSLPSYPNYFEEPTDGFNWGRLHANNAVDIANACGTPIVASAEGLVVPDSDYGDGRDGWNGGYGKFVLIEHPNGTETRYAHMEDISVRIGDYIEGGALLGTMGNTGNVHGPTGCHLHFEVVGAQNPLAR